jgi:competence protein ComEC
MAISPRQSRGWERRIERLLETQRDQLPLWIPVALGCGIAAWFVLPTANLWAAWIAACGGIGFATLLVARGSRAMHVVRISALCLAIGCALAWWRAEGVRAPVLARPVVAQFSAIVVTVEQQAAKARVRITLNPLDSPTLPPKIRVNVDLDKAPAELAPGDRITVRARLIGPPDAAVPGGFDFRRVAWFQGLGATGSAIGSVTVIAKAAQGGDSLRARLSAHVRSQIDGSAGGIAAAFASGDRGGISVEDEEAMRASGLTHLLSVSGLHITAVVGAAMLLTLKLLALSTRAALRLPLILIAAGAGAAAGIVYTLVTGAEVPTIRSCVAAVLILIGIALGRQAFTLRLVATGAIVVLLLWPEALIGPSFQLSFAAITSIVALHEWKPMQRLTGPREEGWPSKIGRGLLSLLATGVAVEIALAPIALFHFHRQGLYGALANIVAIPLTTFVTMPAEALALLADTIGLGAPFWWVTAQSLHLLLWIARTVAAWPGAVAALASVPQTAFALIIGGGLWLSLWKGNVRALGLAPVMAGALWALTTPAPDLIVTGDGTHLAVRGPDGTLATLRSRAGDYVRSVLAERSGEVGDLADLDALPNSDCSADSCRFTVNAGGRQWRILATRSRYLAPIEAMNADCTAADIVVSDRLLPRTCRPKWLKADKAMLAQTGGLAITLASGRVETVREGEGNHPWVLHDRNADARATQ